MKLETLKFELWFVNEMLESIHQFFDGTEKMIKELRYYEAKKDELETILLNNI